jgi:hypothetical protein
MNVNKPSKMVTNLEYWERNYKFLNLDEQQIKNRLILGIPQCHPVHNILSRSSLPKSAKNEL